MTDDGIEFTEWIDNHVVRVARNFHNPEETPGVIDPNRRDEEKEQIKYLNFIIGMGYVDRGDILKISNELESKNRK